MFPKIQLAIGAGVVDQGAALFHAGVKHFADDDIVIASGDPVAEGSLYECQAAREQRHARAAGDPFDTVETITFAGREML
jgi:hypothetical protein